MYHFSPTETSRQNLLRENVGIAESSLPVIQLLMHCYGCVPGDEQRYAAFRTGGKLPVYRPDKKMILVTGHRRESFGRGLKKSAMHWQTSPPRTRTSRLLSGASQPERQRAGQSHSGARKNVILIDPQEYLPFVWLMNPPG